ncbi:molybdenum cofactor biosynthesis protein MoaE [Szabonella alba]|uniref:Molybdopterin synthase catalytic subunit n=1 Tax=Szabonella alba TaxID=2804194 RepID=A0A8K0V7T6_9RHOB|nr:molybdenum cofactor biosynthesis protein MoaE [Szabonella alba]MBL4915831.1 molybdenum cofactor biosynthesis protein MoaE [Szabonella alba]
MRIAVQLEPFDTGAELSGFQAGCAGGETRGETGAVVTFSGVVRNSASGDLAAMEIEHYPGMTEGAIAKFAAEASARWLLTDCLVIHRHGRLTPGETIMMVATAAPHRADAFAAAEFLMDYLKSRAPFWKKEITASGAEWVAAKDSDEAALDRWREEG